MVVSRGVCMYVKFLASRFPCGVGFSQPHLKGNARSPAKETLRRLCLPAAGCNRVRTQHILVKTGTKSHRIGTVPQCNTSLWSLPRRPRSTLLDAAPPRSFMFSSRRQRATSLQPAPLQTAPATTKTPPATTLLLIQNQCLSLVSWSRAYLLAGTILTR